MKLDSNILAQIRQEAAAGFINIQKHPTADLYIHNYSVKAQYDWRWTPAMALHQKSRLNQK